MLLDSSKEPIEGFLNTWEVLSSPVIHILLLPSLLKVFVAFHEPGGPHFANHQVLWLRVVATTCL